jgi:hypothetical protein
MLDRIGPRMKNDRKDTKDSKGIWNKNYDRKIRNKLRGEGENSVK